MASLDPNDWMELRSLGHRMIDDIVDAAEAREDGPVWREMPSHARAALQQPLPNKGLSAAELYRLFQRVILPYSSGNTHPGFMGWVQGGGTLIGALAELLSANLNANCGGRDHAAVEVERQVIRWTAEMLGFEQNASGCLVTGSSMANFMAVLVASRAKNLDIRHRGVKELRWVGYTAQTAHGCVARAFDMAGFGSSALRRLPVTASYQLDLAALRRVMKEDRAQGYTPFLIVGTAGTVDCGAVDDLDALADLAREEACWFHVDGAFGAFAALSKTKRELLKGMDRADSVALDFHKWGQVPYDAGCLIVRDATLHAQAFAQDLDYLHRADRGLAANAPWFCDFGPDLSRGFRALKVWMTLAHYGTEKLGGVIDDCCAVARYLAERLASDSMFELVTPVTLNIVCFRVRGASDRMMDALVKDLHEAGLAAPSTTRIDGRFVIRAAIVNHRTTCATIDQFLASMHANIAARQLETL